MNSTIQCSGGMLSDEVSSQKSDYGVKMCKWCQLQASDGRLWLKILDSANAHVSRHTTSKVMREDSSEENV
jgi:hypothetical protein